MTISPREHARLARELISACGGLDEASRNCRVSASKLSDYQNPRVVLFMPADVMAELEAYCGRAIYSGALSERFSGVTPSADLRGLACGLTEAAATLQHNIRLATEDGKLTPNELDQIAVAEREAETALESVRAARRAADAPHLKPVA